MAVGGGSVFGVSAETERDWSSEVAAVERGEPGSFGVCGSWSEVEESGGSS